MTISQAKKNWLPFALGFVACASILIGATAYAERKKISIGISDIIVIETEEQRTRPQVRNRNDADIEYLLRRQARLERAVRQLQEQVFALQLGTVTSSQKPKKSWACSVEGSFSGTHMGKGETRIEAEAMAMKACQAKETSSIHCDRDDLQCGQAN